MSTPYRLLLEKQRRAAVALREQDADLLQRLEKAGFLGFRVYESGGGGGGGVLAD